MHPVTPNLPVIPCQRRACLQRPRASMHGKGHMDICYIPDEICCCLQVSTESRQADIMCLSPHVLHC